MFATDQFVVFQTTVDQRYCSPGFDAQTCAERKSRSQYQRIEEVIVQPQQIRYSTVIEWARQWRNEVDVAIRSAFEKASARDLDDHFEFGRIERRFHRDGFVDACHVSMLARDRHRSV